MQLELTRDARLVFVGDSITECGRRADPQQLGSGYVRFVRDYLCARDARSAPHVTNAGISGNKVTDLAERWSRDVLALRPSALSIMIGINDVWHGLRGPERSGVDLETFASTYRQL